MPISTREYRQHLYAHRTHPSSAGTITPVRDNLSSLFWTLIPFLVGEYWAELKVDSLPSGIVFPTAYLLFWAFYYTYYRPGSLESKLSAPNKWDLFGLPAVLMGICIWFVKVAVVEFTEVIVSAILPKPKVKRPSVHHKPRDPERPRVETADPNALPKDIENCLAIMGLTGCREWKLIHKRYRELAKKFHPDLNPELTSAGNRFMIYDAAYRRLAHVKEKYFS